MKIVLHVGQEYGHSYQVFPVGASFLQEELCAAVDEDSGVAGVPADAEGVSGAMRQK